MRALTLNYPNRIVGPPARAIVEAEDPIPGPDGVRVRVHYGALSAIDSENSEGKHRFRNQLMLRRNPVVSGIEMAGIAESDGSTIQAGDRVVGYTDITRGPFFHAETVAVREDSLGVLPDSVSLDGAASIVGGALAAIGALERIADVQAGSRVLITAATGGVGAAAVQLARHLGATVAAVCHSTGQAYAEGLGAAETYAYDRSELPPAGAGFDVVFDAAPALSFARARPYLTKNGWYISTMPHRDLTGWFRSRVTSARWGFLLERNTDPQRLGRVVELMDAGALVPMVDSMHRLEDHESAFARQRASGKQGKILLDFTS